jgi:hypothetical protein
MAGDRVFDSPHQWNLYGSSGRLSLGGNFGKVWKDQNGDTLILSKICLTGLWPDRTSREFDFVNLNRDFSVELPQIPVLRHRVVELIEELKLWLDHHGEIHKSFCPAPKNQDFSFHIELPHPHNRIQGRECTIQYSGVGFELGKWSFIVDESCIRILADELSIALRSLATE